MLAANQQYNTIFIIASMLAAELLNYFAADMLNCISDVRDDGWGQRTHLSSKEQPPKISPSAANSDGARRGGGGVLLPLTNFSPKFSPVIYAIFLHNYSPLRLDI